MSISLEKVNLKKQQRTGVLRERQKITFYRHAKSQSQDKTRSKRISGLTRACASEILQSATAAGLGFLLAKSLVTPHVDKSQYFVSRQLRPISCPECRGIGHNTCPECQGRGKQGGVLTKMPLQACGTCRSKGRILCMKCKATGIKNNWLFKPIENGGWGPRGEME